MSREHADGNRATRSVSPATELPEGPAARLYRHLRRHGHFKLADDIAANPSCVRGFSSDANRERKLRLAELEMGAKR